MDPQQQQAMNALQTLGPGIILFFLFFSLAIIAFIIFLFWRIFVKAGLSGPLALLTLLWPIGPLINLCILAFSDWKVAPPANLSPGITPYPPAYPPAAPPTYPPYPPQGPAA